MYQIYEQNRMPVVVQFWVEMYFKLLAEVFASCEYAHVNMWVLAKGTDSVPCQRTSMQLLETSGDLMDKLLHQ